MRPRTWQWVTVIVAGLAALGPALAQEAKLVRVLTYAGPCDASAAAALGSKFLVIGNDEDNMLRIYERQGVTRPHATLDLDTFLRPDPKDREADIEAAATVGSRIYWITSHGRNRKGSERQSRYRFWATESSTPSSGPRLVPIGRPYARLLNDLLADARLKKYNLATAATMSPEEPGSLNIEGMSATPEGTLLLGFRSPVIAGKTLLVSLVNPAQVVAGMRAIFSEPIELDLGGRGIRAIEYWPARETHLLVAGPANDEKRDFQLSLWSGHASEAPVPVKGLDLSGMQPESVIVGTDPEEIELVLDDGGHEIDGTECKDLEPSRQQFRIITVSIKR